jgi:hypothetical protein
MRGVRARGGCEIDLLESPPAAGSSYPERLPVCQSILTEVK